MFTTIVFTKINNVAAIQIKLTWDLKGEQLVTLTQVLHHETYNNTGLKDFGSDDEDDEECAEVSLSATISNWQTRLM